jgi:hypothetical protein
MSEKVQESNGNGTGNGSIARTNGGHFAKGQSPNPGGRTLLKQMFARAAERALEGLRVMALGTDQQICEFFGSPVKLTGADRLQAIIALTNRLYGAAEQPYVIRYKSEPKKNVAQAHRPETSLLPS